MLVATPAAVVCDEMKGHTDDAGNSLAHISRDGFFRRSSELRAVRLLPPSAHALAIRQFVFIHMVCCRGRRLHLDQ